MHWTNAIAFVVLAVSGMVMAFGKFFLLPIIGGTLFGWLTYALKTLHNFVGPLFAVSLVIVFVTFVREQLAAARRPALAARAGGMFGGERAAVAPLQRRREGGVLARRARARRRRRRLRAGARQDRPGPGLPARRHAGGAHGPRRRRDAA